MQISIVLKDWLHRNQLDHDLQFYSRTEWADRGEQLLRDAEFVVTTEGDLHFLLNYSFADPKVDELQDLCESFGFWFELGHTWSVGFYRDDAAPDTAAPSTYAEKLKDPRWIAKANLVKDRAKHTCQDCGNAGVRLEAHHCWYKYGLEPWQYPLDALRCLCASCHKARAPIEHRARTLMARFTAEEVDLIRKSLDSIFHWYDRAAVRAFLQSFGAKDELMIESLARLLQRRTEPGAG